MNDYDGWCVLRAVARRLGFEQATWVTFCCASSITYLCCGPDDVPCHLLALPDWQWQPWWEAWATNLTGLLWPMCGVVNQNALLIVNYYWLLWPLCEPLWTHLIILWWPLFSVPILCLLCVEPFYCNQCVWICLSIIICELLCAIACLQWWRQWAVPVFPSTVNDYSLLHPSLLTWPKPLLQNLLVNTIAYAFSPLLCGNKLLW